MKIIKPFVLVGSLALILTSCGGGAEILSTPLENIDTVALKEAELNENEKHTWGHLDLVKDTIPGMSVDKAYAEIIKGKEGKTVIVAVIDSGIDINHEDLNGVIWTNKKEIAGNGIDDDKNGYIDDIHGWNFLGDAYDEQLEMTRIVANGDTSAPRFAEAKADLEENIAQMGPTKTRYEQIYASLVEADKDFTAHFKTADYTNEQVLKLETTDETLLQHKQVATQMNGFGLPSVQVAKKELKGALEGLTGRLNTNYNLDFKGRTTGDNPDDWNDKPGYGNANVLPIADDEIHGTHVTGIIAAVRDNGKGANGVTNNVEIMSIRAVPNGDEYDKDVAKAIRYAVDNGAKVINGSFGKSFSPHSDWVRDAIKYASDNNVVFVHAAGNDSKDVDTEANFPDDNVNYVEISDTYIRVGALTSKYGSSMVAGFSNYGTKNVDVFAPGAQIYSTFPNNEYKAISGTSMAAPAVAGVAALIWSQYPKLTAAQVKQIIMDSGLPIHQKVVVGGNSGDVRDFSTLSKSGKMVNAYNALIMASQLSK
ncbi:S8 family peptidase [Oceanihabitans sp. 2_MG-2023]|uniref:S8 family peptidase n=1 Tax=Oceanihabitans sp. 2_MG-2023 TaxID=3062661 RepID=UPI0026E35A28|nr:S8 family peptidase [Oceanihabitans sp. 2_MG-2023]MDO6595823.1 S8 family peptidase [Oceanihabitans sp. 2_MG-2023]